MQVQRIIYLFLIAGSMGLFACQQSQTSEASEQDAEEVVSMQLIGEAVELDQAISMAELDEKMAGVDKLEGLVVRGKVVDVCQQKGCWMKLEKPDGQTVRVSFKDYALFMPKDLAGSQVVIRGFAERKETSVEDLRHYAEDAGKSAEEIEAITTAKVELTFEADGVVIM